MAAAAGAVVLLVAGVPGSTVLTVAFVVAVADAPRRTRRSGDGGRARHRMRTGAAQSPVTGRSLSAPTASEDPAAGNSATNPLAEAARRLGAVPTRAAVVARTADHVRAGRRRGFGLVVGITRTSSRAELADADLVLDDVGELDLGALRTDPWKLVYEGFDPAHEGHREALTTLGNGYVGTRGAAPERGAGGAHYPGTYLAGIYNRPASTVQGREVEDAYLVNAPNWLLLDVRVEQGEWWSRGGLRPVRERPELDMRRAVLTRHTELVDGAGRRLRVTQRRLVSLDRPHLAALETTVVPLGWSDRVEIRSGIDAGVTNSNVAEYAGLVNRHLGDVSGSQVDGDATLVEATTTTSRITIATAARTVVSGSAAPVVRDWEGGERRYAQRLRVEVRDGQAGVIDKTVAVVTSRDRAIATPAIQALDELARATGGFDALLSRHERAWERLWQRFEVALDADRDIRLVLNLHVFHLLQAISPFTAEVDAGVPARGLRGEGYRGHVFWDELLVLPIINHRLPAVSRALLGYRWHRLDAARQAARRAGLAGALFPWQSGSDGREETPEQLFNLRSGRWMPDHSRRQLHVGLAVAYDAWQYYLASGDRRWLAERGAELIVEVARLFDALAAYDPAHDRFHIAGVMGPDEYHDGYPEAPGRGLRDNAYTNVLAAWVCNRAVDVLTVLAGHECDDVVARLSVTDEERTRWLRMSRRLAVPFHDGGIISQFDGYEALDELDWDRYRATYGNIGRLDLILEAEGDTTNRYKQADMLMLFYLLGHKELASILTRLGYAVTPDDLARIIDYYLARTAHGSTLSRVVHASVLARIDPARAWDTCRATLVADLDDTQGGTTKEGVHLGAIAGTLDIVARSFAGMQMSADCLTFDPRPPEEIRRAAFVVEYRGQCIDVTLDRRRLRLAARACRSADPVLIRAAGRDVRLGGGQVVEFERRAGVMATDAVDGAGEAVPGAGAEA